MVLVGSRRFTMDSEETAIMNWMQEAIKEPTLIQIDDDFCGVMVLVGSRRFTMDSEEILAIIENSAQACEDLGLGAFCWARTKNYVMTRPEMRPIVPSGLIIGSAKGMMNGARHRKFDGAIHGRADADWTIQTLLDDRAFYCDARFYFDCGLVYSGRGGSVGLITPEVFEASTRALKRKWGAHVSFRQLNWEKKRDVPSLKIDVRRSNKAAQR
jgi:hypothetical protein